MNIIFDSQGKKQSMHKIQLACILLALFMLSNCQNSQALIELSGLEVNSVALINMDQSQSQVYLQQFNQLFQNSPQIALAIVAFEETNMALDTSFYVIPQSITKTGMTLSWSRNIQKWTKMTIKYMASTRSDIILGYKQAVIAQSGNTSTPLTINVNPITNFNTSILRTFLLGCSSNVVSIQCGLLPKSVGNSSFNVDIFGSKMGNMSISFSYLIFSPSTAGFTSYGGYLTNQSFKGVFASDLHKSITFTSYRFHGLSYLNFSTSQQASIETTIDDDLVLQIGTGSLFDRYALFYLIFGRTAKNACSNPSAPYQHLNECSTSCSSDTYIFNYTDGGKACKSCSDILSLALVNGFCIKSNITKKGQNLAPLLDLFHQNSNNKVNLVTQNTTNIVSEDTSTIVTSQLSQVSANTSTSAQTQVQNNQNSQETQQSTNIVNASSNVKTTEYEVVTETASAAVISPNSAPTPMSAPSIPSTASTTYQPQPNTGDSTSSNNIGNVPIQYAYTQQEAYHDNVPSINTAPTCTSNQFSINGVCFCQVGYVNINNQCTSLIVSDPQLQPVVQDNSFSTNILPSVQPPTFTTPPPLDCGQGFDNGLGVCVCSSGLKFYQGRCIYVSQDPATQPPVKVNMNLSTTCGVNMILDQKTKKCVCKDNFVFDLNGQCRSCGVNSQAKQGRCQCLPKFQFHEGECIPVNNTRLAQTCGNGLIEGTQQCDDNNIYNGDGCNQKCQIQNGYNCSKTPSVCIRQAKTNPKLIITENKNDSLTKNQSASANESDINLQLSGQVKANNNQLFLTLDAITPFTFPDQDSMKNFIKAKFIGCSPPTVFCSQAASSKNLFDCLLLFPSGIPNKSFTINFSYNYQAKTGSCLVPVDPLKAQIYKNSARLNSKSNQNSRVSR